MSDNRKIASGVLREAEETITKKRPGVHGSAENSFAMIGDLWAIWLRHARKVRGNDQITPADVAQMMSILKKCRAMYGDQTNRDNFVDDTGYGALAAMLQLPDIPNGSVMPIDTPFVKVMKRNMRRKLATRNKR